MDLRLKTGEVPATGPMSVEPAEPALSTSASTESVAVDENVAATSPFPFSVVMPPGHEVKNYRELDSYLKQSDLIHEAFKSRFGTKKGTTATDDVGTGSQLFDFLSTISENDKRAIFKDSLGDELWSICPGN